MPLDVSPLSHVDHAPDPIDIFVGIRLREIRHKRGLNQSALGELLGVSFQQVQKYERGANRLSASTLVRAAQALDVAPAYFFEGLPDIIAYGEGPDSLRDWLASADGMAWCRIGHRLAPEAFLAVMAVADIAQHAVIPTPMARLTRSA